MGWGVPSKKNILSYITRREYKVYVIQHRHTFTYDLQARFFLSYTYKTSGQNVTGNACHSILCLIYSSRIYYTFIGDNFINVFNERKFFRRLERLIFKNHKYTSDSK